MSPTRALTREPATLLGCGPLSNPGFGNAAFPGNRGTIHYAHHRSVHMSSVVKEVVVRTAPILHCQAHVSRPLLLRFPMPHGSKYRAVWKPSMLPGQAKWHANAPLGPSSGWKLGCFLVAAGALVATSCEDGAKASMETVSKSRQPNTSSRRSSPPRRSRGRSTSR